MVPLPVINDLYKWPYKWLTVLITLVLGVMSPVITGRGAHLGGDVCLLGG